MLLNVDLSFHEMPLLPNTHFKESRNQLLWLGAVSLPHIKKEKSRCTARGWGGCICLFRKPVVGKTQKLYMIK